MAAALLLLLVGAVGPAGAQEPAGSPLVVIDAGHGGADPGALGWAGTREKDVTLAIARELASLLREAPALEVRMTRDRDTLIALRDRPRLANRWRGATATRGRPALFISIHANAHRDADARGVETYFLSDAKTEEARRVAEMENAAERYDAPTAGDEELGFIIADLRRNLYLRDSSAGASLIQARLVRAYPGPDRGVKQAGFLVLDGALMPAVLVEVGFLTNRAEEALLRDRAVQRRIAAHLAAATVEFLGRGSGDRRSAGSW